MSLNYYYYCTNLSVIFFIYNKYINNDKQRVKINGFSSVTNYYNRSSR